MLTLERQETGSAVCYSCEKIISVDAKYCIHCGVKNPGLWGYVRNLRMFLGADLGFKKIVTWGCIGLYLMTLIVTFSMPFFIDIPAFQGHGIHDLLAPNSMSLFLLGGTGSIPVFIYGRWWTLLSAGWLHGGFFHIAFNLLWLHRLAPSIAKFYGAARLNIIYTVAIASGSFLSSWASHSLTFLPSLFQGAELSIGASGGIFGLFGALVAYGEIMGHDSVRREALGLAIVGFLMGFLLGGVDNWGHLGGFLGGYAIAQTPWLSPAKTQRVRDFVISMVCYGLVVLSLIASIVHVFMMSV